MRNILFLMAILAFVTCAAPAPALAGDEGGGAAAGGGDDEFSGVDIEAIKNKPADTGENDPDKPPPIDEYATVPTNLMIPTTEVAPTANGPGSTLKVGTGKVTYETLMKYYKQGKFEDVARELEPLAKGGHIGAQELIGVMYRQGQGVQKDCKKAFEYLTQAANAPPSGRPLAQHHLGIVYFEGDCVPADPVMGLMWVTLAIVHYQDGPEKDAAKHDRDNMYTKLSRRERDRAMQFAKDWLSKRGEAHLLEMNL